MDIKGKMAPIEAVKPKTHSLTRNSKPLSKLDNEKLRLKKATREFESFFLASMLKSMRATVPEGTKESDATGSSLGKEIYQDMFDVELSKKMAEASKGGLGDILYKNLVKRVEAEFSGLTNVASQIGTLKSPTNRPLTPGQSKPDK